MQSSGRSLTTLLKRGHINANPAPGIERMFPEVSHGWTLNASEIHALRAVEHNRRLSQTARTLILDPSATLYVSVVSLWEIAVKHALGRDPEAMPMTAADADRFFKASGFIILPVLSPISWHLSPCPGIMTTRLTRLFSRPLCPSRNR